MSYQEKYKIKYLDSKKQFEQKGGSHLDIPQETKSIDEEKYAATGLTSVTIPDSVTSIGNGAFYGNKLSSVKIPDSITSISNYTFRDNQLTSVEIGNNVTSIGYSAFGHNQLTSITIGDNVISIDDGAFRDNQLTNITIGNNVTSIGLDAFTDNQLTRVTIGYKVKSIGNGAFYKNKLTSVKIPDSITSIGDSAFAKNKLTSLTIGNKVASIGEDAFDNNKLKSVTIPDSVIFIGDAAFSNNELTSVTMPARFNTNKHKKFIFGDKYNIINFIFNNHLEISQGTTIISNGAFSYNQLTGVKIPDSVTSIGNSAFSYNQLTSVEIPDSVTSIDYRAFASNRLDSITIPDSVTSIGAEAFWENKLTNATIPVMFNNNHDKHRIFGYNFLNIIFTIPSINPNNNNLKISQETKRLDNYKKLSSAEIPDSVTGIDNNAFSHNQLRGSATLGNKVTSIGDQAFLNNQLTSVKIPDSVTSIGDGAFINNGLTSVVIPDLVTIIGDDAFARNKLTSVTIGNKVTSIGDGAFINNTIQGNLKIPESVTSIGTTTFSHNELTSVKIPNSVISIGDFAFADNKLTSVKIPDSVTSIGVRAFADNKLTSARIPVIFNDDKNKARIFGPNFQSISYIINGHLKILEGTLHIENKAYQMLELTSLEIPDSVTSIGNDAFWRNQLRGSVIIRNKVTSIGQYAFWKNQLESVIIPDSVTSIGDYAFSNNQLTRVIMPDRFNTNEHRTRIFGENYNIRNIFFNKHLEISQGTTIIGDGAYKKLQLTSVKIPDSVISIGNGAFFRNEITNVKIPDSVTSIGDNAFTHNQLTDVTIPDSVTRIGESAFANNQLLGSVIIPNSVTSIGYNAFANNQLLGSVTIPDKLNNDHDKERIFGSDFTKIIFTILSINPNNGRLFPTVAPVNLVEEHSIFDTIENELKIFGLNIQLGTIDELRVQFKNLVDDPLNFATFKDGVVDASGNQSIELNRAYSDGTIERKFFTFKKHLSSGSFNTTDIYTSNNKEYIFRSSTSSTDEDQFKSFYENLKHIILYIIIRKRLGNIKFIPQPYHFGVKKNRITGQITLYMIMEKGKETLEDYLGKTGLSAEQIKKLVFSIYCDLYELSFLYMKAGDISTILKFKHNDFKCNNLVVSENGAPLIIDFGFSQFTLTDAGRSIKFISCEDSIFKSIYYESEPNGYNVTHDMLQLIASFNFITKRGFKPFEILKFTNNPSSNILDTNVIVSIISALYPAYLIDSRDLFRIFYGKFDLRKILDSISKDISIEITPLELANNIGLTLADRIIDTFEKKYRKYKMKYLNLLKQFEQKGGWHLDIPQGTKNIGKNEYASRELTSVTIPDSVTSINKNAFANNKLTNVTIGNNVTIIDEDAFAGNKLTNVKIGNNVKIIGEGAFKNNKIKIMIIPSSVTYIGNSAFYDNQLMRITIPESIKDIGENAFADNQLERVIIPDSVINIGFNAFGNNKLSSVRIPTIFDNNEDKKRIFGKIKGIYFITKLSK
jgi:hypothetical protein